MAAMDETSSESPVSTFSAAAEAHDMLEQSKFLEAQQLCIEELSSDQSNHELRLLLAQAFFCQGFTPFAVREVRAVLEHHPKNPFLKRLLVQLGDTVAAEESSPPPEVTEIADVEVSFDVLESLDETK